MKLILCVDDKGGLAFNHRRQSRDRVLNERILMHCGMHRLWISPYTAKLFGADTAVRLCIAEDCLERAEEDDYCFAEVHNPAPYLNRVQHITGIVSIPPTGISPCRKPDGQSRARPNLPVPRMKK